MDLLANKVDALVQRFGKLGAPNLGSSSGIVHEVGVVCEICGIHRHMATGYQANFQGVEHANAMQNLNPCPQNNPYSNTYNMELRNHPNFSYRNNNPLLPNTSQPPGFQYKNPFNPPSQPP